MAKRSESQLLDTALQTVVAVSTLPGVRVDREAFLRKHFGDSEHIDVILERGPHAVYSAESLRKLAMSIVKTSAAKTSMASFAAGLVSNPLVMVPAGGADVAQYFGFALNLAQQIAYLFGEEDLFSKSGELNEEAEVRIIGYLGAMLGAGGAAALVATTSRRAAETLGKRVGARTLTQTVWYPVVKKVGAAVGLKVTKKSIEKTVTKAVPVVGGAVSGGLTYMTFRPMGARLIDVLVRNLNGEFDHQMEFNEEFAQSLHDQAGSGDAEEV